MKMRLLIFCSVVMLALTTRAGLITYSPANNVNASIPDGSALGWSGTATASGYLPSISAIRVNLNISGGYNGDLFAYLSYGGVLVPLLTRVGTTSGGDVFGYGTAGMTVTLADGYTDIHTVESPASDGYYSPDGRAIDPVTFQPNFAGGRVNFGSFNGLNPNGTWTLFLADLSYGETSTLVSWSLDITAVPEPVNVALGIFAGVFLVLTVAANRHVRDRVHRWQVAAVQWIDAV
jgi:hypothetical protein